LRIGWFSTGVDSFVACYLANKEKPLDLIIYTHVNDQDIDSLRFLHDCEQALNKKILLLQDTRYNASVDYVCRSYGLIRLPSGFAVCTRELKRRVREEFEKTIDLDNTTYVWGFNCTEKDRITANRGYSLAKENEYPLLDKLIDKKSSHAICAKLGIKRPRMYDMGYQNNNCKGCIKGGMGYWNRIRRDFPDTFRSRAKLERDVGYSILKDDNSKIFLDELDPKRGRFEDDIPQYCDLFCMLETQL
jgi:hypothetical protein